MEITQFHALCLTVLKNGDGLKDLTGLHELWRAGLLVGPQSIIYFIASL